MLKSILDVLPHNLFISIGDSLTDAEELRLRLGQPPAVFKSGREHLISACKNVICREDFEYILASASRSSVYAVSESLRNGYITLPNGHRIGVCGEVIMENGIVKTFRRVSSAVIRIAKEHVGIGLALNESCLIIGPPGAGKTTLLRDCIRILSDECLQNVGLVDERGEVAAAHNCCPGFHIGRRTDILTGCSKAIGLDMLTRTMSPQWIALDEITREADVDALCRASYCGVKLLATAHAFTADDLLRRPIYRRLMDCKVFDCILSLQKNHTYTLERLKER